MAAVLGGSLDPATGAFTPDALAPARYCRGRDVLELGCGRALPGLLAGALGARSVTVTDCDHRALDALPAAVALNAAPASFGSHGVALGLATTADTPPAIAADTASTAVPCSVRHLVWQRDEQRLRGDEAAADDEACTLPHWSAAYPGATPALRSRATYDLLVVSDCLYFTVQEAPLAASVAYRLRRPHGVGVLVCAARNGWGLPSLHRFADLLRGHGLTVVLHCRDWPWTAMHAAHGAAAGPLAETTTDTSDAFVFLVSWPPAA